MAILMILMIVMVLLMLIFDSNVMVMTIMVKMCVYDVEHDDDENINHKKY